MALATLSSPDEFSRSTEHEGRRIVAVDGGWQILNYLKYREKGQGQDGSRAPYFREYRERYGGSWPTPKRRAALMARDNHACRRCGSVEDLTLDHIIAVANGGSDDDSNLQVLCAECNRNKRSEDGTPGGPRRNATNATTNATEMAARYTEAEAEVRGKKHTTDKQTFSADAEAVFGYWRERTGTNPRSEAVRTKALGRISKRLGEGFSAADLKACVDFALSDAFYVEKGYAKDPAVIWKDSERVQANASRAPVKTQKQKPVVPYHMTAEYQREERATRIKRGLAVEPPPTKAELETLRPKGDA